MLLQYAKELLVLQASQRKKKNPTNCQLLHCGNKLYCQLCLFCFYLFILGGRGFRFLIASERLLESIAAEVYVYISHIARIVLSGKAKPKSSPFHGSYPEINIKKDENVFSLLILSDK